MRKKQAEAQDSEEEDSSSQHDVKAAAASDLLSVTIEQSAKEYLVFSSCRWLAVDRNRISVSYLTAVVH